MCDLGRCQLSDLIEDSLGLDIATILMTSTPAGLERGLLRTPVLQAYRQFGKPFDQVSSE